jgi:RNase P subunit RPR2
MFKVKLVCEKCKGDLFIPVGNLFLQNKKEELQNIQVMCVNCNTVRNKEEK